MDINITIMQKQENHDGMNLHKKNFFLLKNKK